MNDLLNKYSGYHGESVKIAVIDSGIDKQMLEKKLINVVFGTSVNKSDEINYLYSADFFDEIGHGTAVISTIYKIVDKADFFIIKAFRYNEFKIDTKTLIKCLEYIYINLDVDIIQISSGTVAPDYDDLQSLKDIIKCLQEQGVIIVAAFDNLGAISYPAALNNVIGVDSSSDCVSIYDYKFVEGSCINIIGRGVNQKVDWLAGETKNVVGSSFSSSYITGIIAKFIQSGVTNIDDINSKLKEYSKETYSPHLYKETDKLGKINKAIIFPFNKELHSVVEYADMLDFSLKDIYTFKYDKALGKLASTALNKKVKYDYIIKNYIDIPWDDDFDTVIIGHCDKISHISHRDYKHELINLCLKNNKNAYCFDSLGLEPQTFSAFKERGLELFIPSFKVENIWRNRFGRLKILSIPVVLVSGTSSIQGKFHIQLGLKKLFEQDDYKVGYLGTEPAANMYGCDEVFPFGYNANVMVKGIDAVLAINQLMERIEERNKDVIIVGSQSISTPPSEGNLAHFPCSQTELLFGTRPDVIILAVNFTDEIDYIKRTIKMLEGGSEGKVLAVALYPLIRNDVWAVLDNHFQTLSSKDLEEKITLLKKELNLPVYLQNDEGVKSIYLKIIDYLTGD